MLQFHLPDQRPLRLRKFPWELDGEGHMQIPSLMPILEMRHPLALDRPCLTRNGNALRLQRHLVSIKVLNLHDTRNH